MNVFGKTIGGANDIYVKLGLKKRTNKEVRDVFVKEIEGLCEKMGLTIPDWSEEENLAIKH